MKFFILKTITTTAFVALLSCGNNALNSEPAVKEAAAEMTQTTHSLLPNEEISLDMFNKTIADNKVTVVDFYTTWCGPCKAMAPHVEKIKADYKGKANVLSVDAEKYVEIAEKYFINAYPTIIYFKNGVAVSKDLGYQTYDQLKNKIDALSK